MGIPSDATSGKNEGDGMCTDAGSTRASGSGCSGSFTRRPRSSSVYLRCHQSSREWTVGTSAKLYGGTGDWIDHSSVRASHGSAGAPYGPRWVLTMFQIITITDAA